MNGILTALIKSWKSKKLCHHVEERRGEKTSYFNHIMQRLMKTTKCGITENIYYLGENFALSLLTEICTRFGIMEFSLNATTSSR